MWGGDRAAVSMRSVNFKNQQSTNGLVLRADLCLVRSSQQISGESWGLGWNGNIFSTENGAPMPDTNRMEGLFPYIKIFDGLFGSRRNSV